MTVLCTNMQLHENSFSNIQSMPNDWLINYWYLNDSYLLSFSISILSFHLVELFVSVPRHQRFPRIKTFELMLGLMYSLYSWISELQFDFLQSVFWYFEVISNSFDLATSKLDWIARRFKISPRSCLLWYSRDSIVELGTVVLISFWVSTSLSHLLLISICDWSSIVSVSLFTVAFSLFLAAISSSALSTFSRSQNL